VGFGRTHKTAYFHPGVGASDSIVPHERLEAAGIQGFQQNRSCFERNLNACPLGPICLRSRQRSASHLLCCPGQLLARRPIDYLRSSNFAATF
jgi:hypothetical protein